MKAQRCEGAITRGSVERWNGPEFIGCNDAERINEYYNYLRNLDPIPRQPSRHNLLSLPSFIPVLETGMPRELKLNPDRLYGVYLRSVIDRYGNFKYRTAETLRKGLRLPMSGRLALFATATDALIERAWKNSISRDLWARLATFNFEFVTSATFSVYEDEPRSDQIHNQDRNFRSYGEFSRFGIPCIPFLFFNSSSDLDYQHLIWWLRTHGDVEKVAILAHSFSHMTAFERLLIQTRTIANDAGRQLQFVFVGAATIDKVKLVLSEYSNAVFVNTQPVAVGRVGDRIISGLEREEVAISDVDKATLMVENIQQFDNAIDRERLRYLPREAPFQRFLPFHLPPFAQ